MSDDAAGAADSCRAGPKDPLLPHDLVLQCTDGQVHTHRQVVGLGAKVIGGCISSTAAQQPAVKPAVANSGGDGQQGDGSPCTVPTLDEKAADMELFCSMLYPDDSCPQVTMDNAEVLVRLATKFGAPRVLLMCETFFRAHIPSLKILPESSGSSDAQAVASFRQLLKIMCISEEYSLLQTAAAAAQHLRSDNVHHHTLPRIFRSKLIKGTAEEVLNRALPLESDVLGDIPPQCSSCWRSFAVISRIMVHKLGY